MHVLLHAALAAILASAAFSVARAQGWSTAQLSQARQGLSATSVGTMAIFAGGGNNTVTIDTVDLYDSETGRWSTAQLTQGRTQPASASVGTVAIFAGGYYNNGSKLLELCLFVG
jgi:hypothetical protein